MRGAGEGGSSPCRMRPRQAPHHPAQPHREASLLEVTEGSVFPEACRASLHSVDYTLWYTVLSQAASRATSGRREAHFHFIEEDTDVQRGYEFAGRSGQWAETQSQVCGPHTPAVLTTPGGLPPSVLQHQPPAPLSGAFLCCHSSTQYDVVMHEDWACRVSLWETAYCLH